MGNVMNCQWRSQDLLDRRACRAQAGVGLYCARHARDLVIDLAVGRLIEAERDLIRWIHVDRICAMGTAHDVGRAWKPYIDRMRIGYLRALAAELAARPFGERLDPADERERELITRAAPWGLNAADARLEHLDAVRAFTRASALSWKASRHELR